MTSAQLEIGSSILWGDLPDELHDDGVRDTTVRSSDVRGGGGSGSAWWTGSPVPRTLVAADAADLDSNGNRTEPAPLGLDRLPRLVDRPARPDTGLGTPPIVDMGACEVQSDPAVTVTRAGTGTGTVTSTAPAGAIACGPTCIGTLPPARRSPSRPAAGSGSSSLAWVGALFLQAPMADLAIAVTSAGPSDVAGATATDVFPPTLGTVTRTCLASTGSSSAASGSGSIADTVSVLANGSLTNTATDSDQTAPFADLSVSLDFGHAPDAALYPVPLAEDGARHGIVAGFHLGATVSPEADATPSLSSTGEPDDHGAAFTSPLVTCETATVTVTASAPGSTSMPTARGATPASGSSRAVPSPPGRAPSPSPCPAGRP